MVARKVLDVLQLKARAVPKIWGRNDLGGRYGIDLNETQRMGEIWFESPAEAPLLVKYLFTSERLSIQVHPDDESAFGLGLRSGKDEAWIVLEAEPDAVIGIGLEEAVDEATLRAAALDGSIEGMMDWAKVKAGDAFYSPAGAVHALGGGLKLVEIQQNIDATYRLYDYGRARDLQIEDAVALAKPGAKAEPLRGQQFAPGRKVMIESPAFTFEQWSSPLTCHVEPPSAQPVWLIPITPGVALDGVRADPSTVWVADEPFHAQLHDSALMLVAYIGRAADLAIST
jgi:mannose-6-phosphate isomerase